MNIKRFGSKNLILIDNKVISYESHVATIKGQYLVVNPIFISFSKTTTKHINLIAKEYNLHVIAGNHDF